MKTGKLNYHRQGLKKASIFKIAVVVVFSLVFNAINLSAFYKADIYADKNIIQLGTGLSRIYSNINLPIKIVNDLFNSGNSFNDVSNDTQTNLRDVYAVIFHKKSNTKSTEEIKSSALPFSGGSAKFVINGAYLFSERQYKSLFDRFDNNDFRCLLLLLIIMLSLPRGIPVRIKKMLNITFFACPILFYNKIGFFRFYTASNGGLNENN